MLDQNRRKHRQEEICESVEGADNISQIALQVRIQALLLRQFLFTGSPENVQLAAALTVEAGDSGDVEDSLKADYEPDRPLLDTVVGASQEEHGDAERNTASHRRKDAPAKGIDAPSDCLRSIISVEVEEMVSKAIMNSNGYQYVVDDPKDLTAARISQREDGERMCSSNLREQEA